VRGRVAGRGVAEANRPTGPRAVPPEPTANRRAVAAGIPPAVPDRHPEGCLPCRRSLSGAGVALCRVRSLARSGHPGRSLGSEAAGRAGHGADLHGVRDVKERSEGAPSSVDQGPISEISGS
jgi:hypothetical protein